MEKLGIENKNLKQELEETVQEMNSKEDMIRDLNTEINDIKLKLIEAEDNLNQFKNGLDQTKELKTKLEEAISLKVLEINFVFKIQYQKMSI